MTELDTLERRIITCRKCPRLVSWREQIALEKRRAYQDWNYWGRPVPGFGDFNARVLVVGLAPGAHGSNRTGRMFTGDASGDFLFPALYKAHFSNQPMSKHLDDGLELQDLFISAVCRCAPPANKPTADEIENCLPYLEQEIAFLYNLEGFVALGRIAFEQLLRVTCPGGITKPRFRFEHGAFYQLGRGRPWLIASYHPSRQNTQTGRLTAVMFDEVWDLVRRLLV